MHRLTAQLLHNRGFRTEQEIRRFLNPRLSDLRSPEGPQPMAGFSVAVERLRRAILDRETIGVVGDSDVDGVTTCALLAEFLSRAGARAQPRLASRSGGYGFSNADAHDLAKAGCSLIVAGDCGSGSHNTLALCRTLGVDVIIVDHHQVPDPPPDALALLNPHQPGCAFPFKGLASVGLAFLLCAALRAKLEASGWPYLPDLHDLLDLVALGTIADRAPLIAENRVLVHVGLKELRRGRRPGLRLLALLAGLREGASSASDVSFRLAPRLNAPGRLGDAHAALQLLIETDLRKAKALAETCHELNMRRQEIQEGVLKEARAQAEELLREGQKEVLVVTGHGWHPGVVGVVASALADLLRLPVAVLSLQGERCFGSARGTEGAPVFQAVQQAAPLLQHFGGHAFAAGFALEASRLGEFKEALLAFFRQHRSAQTPPGAPGAAAAPAEAAEAEAEVSLSELLRAELLEELRLLEPCGQGNPPPRLLARGLLLEDTWTSGAGSRLNFALRHGSSHCTAFCFQGGAARRFPTPPRGSRVSAVLTPEFSGRGAVRFRAVAVFPEFES